MFYVQKWHVLCRTVTFRTVFSANGRIFVKFVKFLILIFEKRLFFFSFSLMRLKASRPLKIALIPMLLQIMLQPLITAANLITCSTISFVLNLATVIMFTLYRKSAVAPAGQKSQDLRLFGKYSRDSHRDPHVGSVGTSGLGGQDAWGG